jgi:hypothetical protein
VSLKLNHEIYGIAMTLYHYYTYFKMLREINPLELSVACIYLARKIQFEHISMEEVIKIYNIQKDKIKDGKKEPPDFIKYEMEFYYFLGYDLDIETPYNSFYRFIKTKEGESFGNEKIKTFLFNLINDTYRRSLCLYYHPKIIMLSCLIFTIKFLEENINIEEKLPKEDIIIIGECMEKIYDIFDIEKEENKSI